MAISKLTSGAVGNSWSRSKFVIQLLVHYNLQLSLFFPLRHSFSWVLFSFVFI